MASDIELYSFNFLDSRIAWDPKQFKKWDSFNSQPAVKGKSYFEQESLAANPEEIDKPKSLLAEIGMTFGELVPIYDVVEQTIGNKPISQLKGGERYLQERELAGSIKPDYESSRQRAKLLVDLLNSNSTFLKPYFKKQDIARAILAQKRETKMTGNHALPILRAYEALREGRYLFAEWSY